MKTKQGVKALVHGCEFRLNNSHTRGDTVLLEKWELSYHDLQSSLPRDRKNRGMDYTVPLLSWVDTASIRSRCLVIEEEPGVHEVVPTDGRNKRRNTVLMVRQRRLWASEFTEVFSGDGN